MPAPQLTIAHPCQESWDAMAPCAGGRHCGRCDQTVVDLTTLSSAEIDTFLTSLEIKQHTDPSHHICLRVRSYVSSSTCGDPPAQPRPSRSRRRLTNGMAGLIAMSLAGCVGIEPELSQRPVFQPTTIVINEAVKPDTSPTPRAAVMGTPVVRAFGTPDDTSHTVSPTIQMGKVAYRAPATSRTQP